MNTRDKDFLRILLESRERYSEQAETHLDLFKKRTGWARDTRHQLLESLPLEWKYYIPVVWNSQIKSLADRG